MQRFYREYYKKYIQALQNAADKADRSGIRFTAMLPAVMPLTRCRSFLDTLPSLFYFLQCPAH
jgi:hypothetical protein